MGEFGLVGGSGGDAEQLGHLGLFGVEPDYMAQLDAELNELLDIAA